uniref:Uncharacterized protein n=1 Tax=Anopheles maculatus TaxID=74869 RepID=A0A182STG8_9DIPT
MTTARCDQHLQSLHRELIGVLLMLLLMKMGTINTMPQFRDDAHPVRIRYDRRHMAHAPYTPNEGRTKTVAHATVVEIIFLIGSCMCAAPAAMNVIVHRGQR